MVTVFGSELNRNESWRKCRVWMINGYYESIINSWLTSMLALRCSLEVGCIRSYKGRPHEWCINFIFCWIAICRCVRSRNGSKLHAADCNHQMVKVILSTAKHMHICRTVFARGCSQFIPISCLLIKTDKEKHWDEIQENRFTVSLTHWLRLSHNSTICRRK